MDEFAVGSKVRLIHRAQLFVTGGSIGSIHKGNVLECIQPVGTDVVEGRADFVLDGRQFVQVKHICPKSFKEMVGYVRAMTLTKVM